VKISQIKDLNEMFYEATLRDMTGLSFYIKLKKQARWKLEENDVIRMRSVALDHNKGIDENILFLNPRSNIMKFLKNSKITREIVQDVSEDEKIMKLMICEEEKCILDKP
jgi:DNA polymerase III alpha subunit (gram-positive type)